MKLTFTCAIELLVLDMVFHLLFLCEYMSMFNYLDRFESGSYGHLLHSKLPTYSQQK